jgi:hypothetical protein
MYHERKPFANPEVRPAGVRSDGQNAEGFREF